ncbi:hypothetical protein GUJ93_ZPchr0012g19753 [Zizania palustris]|uniref:Uncharacterized protein n=1 Tax=Zizania palustris TaxID=103762 RepID=A0A8J6BVV6_ZIZPA|nr:hypothetical protein GUJ93_ZPchr0012g19753 [Zizania palustris]
MEEHSILVALASAEAELPVASDQEVPTLALGHDRGGRSMAPPAAKCRGRLRHRPLYTSLPPPPTIAIPRRSPRRHAALYLALPLHPPSRRLPALLAAECRRRHPRRPPGPLRLRSINING